MTPSALFIITSAIVIALGSIKVEKKDTVLLLADEDGKVGKISVKTDNVEKLIDKEKYFVSIKDGQISELSKMNDEEFNKRYAKILSFEPKKPKSFILYFEPGTDTLTAESLPVINDIIKEIESRKDPEVVIIGHTDSVGSKELNYNLGLKRAESTKNTILTFGIKESTISEVISHGEEDPLISVPDETPEPKNRRVEIVVK